MPSFIANIVAMVPAFAGTTPVSPRPYEIPITLPLFPPRKPMRRVAPLHPWKARRPSLRRPQIAPH